MDRRRPGDEGKHCLGVALIKSFCELVPDVKGQEVSIQRRGQPLLTLAEC